MHEANSCPRFPSKGAIHDTSQRVPQTVTNGEIPNSGGRHGFSRHHHPKFRSKRHGQEASGCNRKMEVQASDFWMWSDRNRNGSCYRLALDHTPSLGAFGTAEVQMRYESPFQGRCQINSPNHGKAYHASHAKSIQCKKRLNLNEDVPSQLRANAKPRKPTQRIFTKHTSLV